MLTAATALPRGVEIEWRLGRNVPLEAAGIEREAPASRCSPERGALLAPFWADHPANDHCGHHPTTGKLQRRCGTLHARAGRQCVVDEQDPSSTDVGVDEEAEVVGTPVVDLHRASAEHVGHAIAE
jgi:hypothetical protein